MANVAAAMNQQPSLEPRLPRKPPPAIVGKIRRAAKWPPDDDAPGAPPPGGAGYYGGGDDGNFKKGRFKVVGIILVFLAIVAGLFVSRSRQSRVKSS